MPEREGEFFNKHQTTALEKLVYIICLNPERGGEFLNKDQTIALEKLVYIICLNEKASSSINTKRQL
jgi:hypothetical protein